MGLLDSAMQPQAPQQPQGVLGPVASMQGQQPSPRGLQMAQALAQSPTPQMVQQIIGMLHSSGNPEAQAIEQQMRQLGDDPGMIKQFADMLLQHIQGGGNA
jgi:hypothetical protein